MICWPLREFEWCLFQVRVVVPYQGPSSDYVVVRMIPDSRLPPRHLHVVHMGQTSAVIKWESPYDSPDQDLVSGPGVLATLLILDVVWFGDRGSCNGAGHVGLVHGAQQEFPPHFCLAKDRVLIDISSLLSCLCYSWLLYWFVPPFLCLHQQLACRLNLAHCLFL